jgi:hypothetical protein
MQAASTVQGSSRDGRGPADYHHDGRYTRHSLVDNSAPQRPFQRKRGAADEFHRVRKPARVAAQEVHNPSRGNLCREGHRNPIL